MRPARRWISDSVTTKTSPGQTRGPNLTEKTMRVSCSHVTHVTFFHIARVDMLNAINVNVRKIGQYHQRTTAKQKDCVWSVTWCFMTYRHLFTHVISDTLMLQYNSIKTSSLLPHTRDVVSTDMCDACCGLDAKEKAETKWHNDCIIPPQRLRIASCDAIDLKAYRLDSVIAQITIYSKTTCPILHR